MVFLRLPRRVTDCGLNGFDENCALLESPGGEAEMLLMVSARTTNKTEFFREGQHFSHFDWTAIPVILGVGARHSR